MGKTVYLHATNTTMLDYIQDPAELQPSEASEYISWTSGITPQVRESPMERGTDMYGLGWIVF